MKAPGPIGLLLAATWGASRLFMRMALLASGVAYLLYCRLIADLGPTGAPSVAFLVPAFVASRGRRGGVRS